MAKIDEQEMMPIPINDFISGMAVPADLYVKIGKDNFVLICKSGTQADKSQLSTYKDRTIDYLWLRKDQYTKVVSKNLAIAGIVVSSDKLNSKQKTQVITATAKSVFNEFTNLGFTIDTYNHATQVVEATTSLIEAHNDLYAIFSSLNECSNGLLRHSMAVSVLSTLIGQEIGWKNKQTLEKLALGGLLHDIGLKALPPSLLDMPKAAMTYEEIQLYESHPYKGMQMLLEIGIVPDDVVAIVYEHHENSFGQGFPQKLRNLKIHPLARVVALANEFVNLTIRSSRVHEPKNPREALIVIEHTMGQPYNKEAFRALERLVNKDNVVDEAV